MVEVTIDSIRVSLMSQLRLVVLKDITRERYLTIFIGPFEAEAITIKLQNMSAPRPLTHDLLQSVIHHLGGEVREIFINDLRDDIFFAEVIVEVNGREVRIDSRPSDAIALAVRAGVRIFVAETVMERAATTPDEEVKLDAVEEEEEPVEDADLSAFGDFLETLDLDDL